MVSDRAAALPPTAKGRATRERIVDAACDLVFERGAATLNLDDVRAATGTSKSQLYHYFADKSDLLRAVLVRQSERVLGLHGPVLASVDSWVALRRWRDLVVRSVRAGGCRGGCPVGSLANELAEHDELSRVQLAVVFDEWQRMLVDALRRMVDRGDLAPDAAVDDLALATMASLQGGLLLTKTTRSPRAIEIALDSALGYLESFATPH